MRLPFLLLLGAALSACQTTNSSEEATSNRPNILFCIADDASFPHMGAYGCSWVSTPGFDRVAREGLLFTRAYTPNAKCAPSRSCILTGRNSWQLEEAVNHWPHFPAKFTTYAETLTDHGYHVGYTAKGWAPGNPGQVNGQRRQLTGTPYNTQKTTPPTAAMSDNDYAANFADFLDCPSRRCALLLLVRLHRTAPRLRLRFGNSAGKQATQRHRCGAALLARQRFGAYRHAGLCL